MAASLKSLEMLPMELQEMILEEFSTFTDCEYIEIDGTIYSVHKKVSKLIDALVSGRNKKDEEPKYKG
tara:strand:- start:5516 stop:5719 length:204 start_codon:yes stop_codon:yes gene_type:complete